MNMNRREFSVRTIYGLTALIGAGVAAPAVMYVFGSPVEHPSGWMDVGEVSSLPEGQPVEVPVLRIDRDGWKISSERESVWVVKNNDSLTVFSPRCTHLGCAYHWDSTKKVFVCPCHGSVFSETGAVLSGPAPRPLDRLVTKIEGDRLWVSTQQRS